MLTATAIESFQGQIDAVPLLALFMPMIVSTGGNSGSQASTLVIRAMALGEVRAADWWLILRRELLTGLALGARARRRSRIVRVAIWGAVGALRRALRPARASSSALSVHRLRAVRHARRLDAAVRAAQARRRPRERVGAVRRDARRRQRHPDLLRDREHRPARASCSDRLAARCSPRASTIIATRRRSSSGSRSCASRA